MINCLFKGYVVFTGSYYWARYFDLGLANVFGLITFRHGTNPLSWVAIHLFGAFPALEGACFGGGQVQQQVPGMRRFYVADAGSSRILCSVYRFSSTVKLMHRRVDIGSNIAENAAQMGLWMARGLLIPVQIARLGGTWVLHSRFLRNKWEKRELGRRVSTLVTSVAFLVSSFFPLIRMRFSESERKEWFAPDLDEHEAWATSRWIPPFRNGLVGTIWSALSVNTPSNIWSQKGRVVTGLAQLAMVTVSAYLARSLYSAHKIAILAGIILAVV
jgi:hypothetical protein